MPIDARDEGLLAQIYRNLKEQPIDPEHPFYVRIWEDSPHDPVRRLRKHIQWSEVESLQLFSGFSGSGKTTQLRRLQQELEREGYHVIYANAEDYLNLGEAVDITDLLITVTGAFSDKLYPRLLRESYCLFQGVSLRLAALQFRAPRVKTVLVFFDQTLAFRSILSGYAIGGPLCSFARRLARIAGPGDIAVRGFN